MSQLNRNAPKFHIRNPRPLAHNRVATAKAQAYLLRDLIARHGHCDLSGGDVTDTLALTYHGTDWAALVATLRGASEKAYYACASGVIHQQAAYLAELVGIPLDAATRALIDMPRAYYYVARTLPGALLATLLAGRPSWELPVVHDGSPVIYDARTDRPYRPDGFSSDPMTNAERVRGVSSDTGEVTMIPVELVRGVSLSELGAAVGDELAAHHYAKAVSEALARRWYDAGNDLYVVAVHRDGAAVPGELSNWNVQGHHDFGAAVDALRGYHGGVPLIFLPMGLGEVHHPDERWYPKMRLSRAILPEVEAADAEYQAALDRITKATGNDEASAILSDATRAYNAMLVRALDAFWRDTREINSRDALLSGYGPGADPSERLALGGCNPLRAFRELIGLDKRR